MAAPTDETKHLSEADVRELWEANASAWGRGVSRRWDFFRHEFHDPAFLPLLGQVEGTRFLDLACGEGVLSRWAFSQGATVTGVDISAQLIAQASRSASNTSARFHTSSISHMPQYLRDRGHDVVTRDFGALQATWRTVCRLLVADDFDLIAVFNDFDAIDGIERFLHYCRELQPQARLLTFGRASRLRPQLFTGLLFDAIAWSGDYEDAVGSYVDHLVDGLPTRGVMLRTGPETFEKGAPGAFLPAPRWSLPDVREIPYDAYERLYSDDLDKFCGIPDRRELVVPLARGCPVGCAFCDVPKQQGSADRRLSVQRTLDYIESSLSHRPFDYVSFYAPTFTLRRRWVEEFCEATRDRLPALRWKCVTTLGHLNEGLLRTMAEAGCVRVSVGLETTHLPTAREHLPGAKAATLGRFEEVSEWCLRADIELNCFVMLGMLGEPLAHARTALDQALEAGHRVRPTLYTDYQALPVEGPVNALATANRQLLQPGSPLGLSHRRELYQLLHRTPGDRRTRVSERILSHPGLLSHCNPHVRQLEDFSKNDARDWLNLKSNELQHPKLRAIWERFDTWEGRTRQLSRYPVFDDTLGAVAAGLGCRPEQVCLAAGSDGALRALAHTLGGTGRCILPAHCYAGTERAVVAAGLRIRRLPPGEGDRASLAQRLEQALREEGPCMVFLENPNGQDGELLELPVAAELAASCARAGALLIVDEAYGDFAPIDHTPLVADLPNLIVLRTLSKSHGAAGLRLAFLFASPPLVGELRRCRMLNEVSQAALDFARFAMLYRDDFAELATDVRSWRARVHQELSAWPGWAPRPSAANFILVGAPSTATPRALLRSLEHHKVRMRVVPERPGHPLSVRLTIPSPEDLPRALLALAGGR